MRLRRKPSTEVPRGYRTRRGRLQSSYAPASRRRTAARDHVSLVVEPQAAVLFQHPVGRFEIASVANHFRQPDILDLRDIDRGIPRGEQRRGSDWPAHLVWKRMHVIAENRT